VTYEIVFGVASVVAIVSALGVVLSGNPFYSALSLLLNLASLATLYLLLEADFLAAAQVIVYAGAVMIMFLFVIAYLGGRAHEPVRERPWWQWAVALIAAAAIATEVIVVVVSHQLGKAASVAPGYGSAQVVAEPFLSRYLLAFEATSILLLVAAVGGVVLGARRPGMREPGEPDEFPEMEQAPPASLMTTVMESQTRFEITTAKRRSPAPAAPETDDRAEPDLVAPPGEGGRR
jgi:NADH-quinone oxidoreductase subunit J